MITEQFGFNYTQVCGYVRGYQHRSTDAFGDFGSVNTIADGVSITAGATHVWTYAAGFQEAKRDPIKTLSPTTATLNVDLCVDEVGNENIGVEQLELYIK